MEKTLSPDERIKRAEEIYYRKKIQARGRSSARVNVSDKKDFILFKKMILQIIICILIYSIFYMIQNTNYIFSEDVINKTKEILSYDVNIKNLYEQVMQYLSDFSSNVEEIFSQIQDENTIDNDNDENNEGSDSEDTNELQEENIGGENVEVSEDDETVSQMEQDAKDILGSKSLIIPLNGTITSRFGPRDSDNPIVSKNHTGIDIAANEGTVFVASMEGVVDEVSSERRFGESFYNFK